MSVEEDYDPPFMGMSLYGWDVWRVFRAQEDDGMNIILIQLKKGDKCRSFRFETEEDIIWEMGTRESNSKNKKE